MSRFRGSTRRNIRKASENGVRVNLLTTEESTGHFYKLNERTRKDHGLPPQPYRFFEEVYKQVISKGHGFVAAAFSEKRMIAASVYFHFGGNAVYKYGASDKHYWSLRPNDIVMWEAVKWYIENGYRTISLGRTDLTHKGLRQFKNGWGAAEGSINYYRYSLKTGKFMKDDSRRAKFVSNRAVSLAPMVFLRAMGSLLYKHVG